MTLLRFILTTMLLVSFLCSKGQTDYFSIKSVKKGKELSFPIFSNSINGNSSSKINQHLQISELEILKGFEKEHLFENVSDKERGVYGGKVELRFDIKNNTNKFLSVQLNEASCGMTCAYWVKYYNFNSGNGELFQLRDLFTKTGYKSFYKTITKRRIKDFKKELTKLTPTGQKDFMDIIGCYEDDDLNDFYIKGSNIFVDGENCFSKNQKFDGIKTVSKINLSEFQDNLNDYGKAIFSLSEDSVANYHSVSLPQLFHGKIGKQDILMVLNNGFGKEMKAEYVYLKYGMGIYLKGEINNQKLILNEENDKSEGNAVINATFDQMNILGTWSDKIKKYTIHLTRK